MNKRVGDAIGEDAATVPKAAGHECANSRPRRLASVLRHEPVVVVLFLIAASTTISGEPVHGVLLALAAIALAWDAARRPGDGREPSSAAAAVPSAQAQARPRRTRPAGRRWQLLSAAGLALGGVLYAVIAGSFTRYSWPATIAVAGLAIVVVAAGWGGPGQPRPGSGSLRWPGAAWWPGLLVAAGLWELAALLLQPSLTTASYAHPTISALTDPFLASHPGRSVALVTWIAIGWYLERR